jgi:hypothetical protein
MYDSRTGAENIVPNPACQSPIFFHRAEKNRDWQRESSLPHKYLVNPSSMLPLGVNMFFRGG